MHSFYTEKQQRNEKNDENFKKSIAYYVCLVSSLLHGLKGEEEFKIFPFFNSNEEIETREMNGRNRKYFFTLF